MTPGDGADGQAARDPTVRHRVGASADPLGSGLNPEERLGLLLEEITGRQERREERMLLTPEGSPWPTGREGLEALSEALRRTARLS